MTTNSASDVPEPFAELVEQVRGVAVAAADELTVPGLAIVVVEGDREAYVTHGVTNVAHPLEVTPETIFQTGSISKVITAIAAVSLADEGMLDLDEPVMARLPELRLDDAEALEEVTARHLLTHSAGFAGDYDVDQGRGDDALERMLPTIAAAPQWTRPGAVMHYCNLGYVLLGRLMEVVGDEPFESLVASRVLEPLGMHDSHYFLEEVAAARVAAGHRVDGGAAQPTGWVQPRTRGPNGGVMSTVVDLAKLIRFSWGDGCAPNGTRLLSAATHEQMLRPVLPTSPGSFMGLGWMLRPTDRGQLAGHAGATVGFSSMLQSGVGTWRGYAVLTNSASSAPMYAELDRVLFPWLPEREDRDGGLSPDAHAEFVGRYTGQEWSFEVRQDSDGSLVTTAWDGLPGMVAGRLLLVSSDELAHAGPTGTMLAIAVVRDVDGDLLGLRMGHRLVRKETAG